MDWQLQDAKNQFSKVVRRARTEGPQVITLCGKRVAVVLSAQDYDALHKPKPNLVDHLRSSPAWDDELVEMVKKRDGSLDRDIEF